ncbi:hypothetical protein [Lysinibacillus agricola]|uniref:hypothetical protein n=1 Tax=Lysinibacillus agricola TaxID=2590012 RepID=UPI003C23E908
MEKVNLSQKQADMLEVARNWYSTEKIMELYISPQIRPAGMRLLKELDIGTLVSALIHGYEIQLTAEEKAVKYYEDLTKKVEDESLPHHEKEWAMMQSIAVREVLDLLGIKIQGINE